MSIFLDGEEEKRNEKKIERVFCSSATDGWFLDQKSRKLSRTMEIGAGQVSGIVPTGFHAHELDAGPIWIHNWPDINEPMNKI